MTDVIPHVLIAPKNKLIDFPGHVNIFDDQGFGFDYQEHLIRKVFNEEGPDIYLFLIYEDYQKSAGFDRTRIFPKDSFSETNGFLVFILCSYICRRILFSGTEEYTCVYLVK